MLTFVEPAELAAIRAQIGELQQDITALQAVPLSEAESLKRAELMVNAHAARAQTNLILAHLIHGDTPIAVYWPVDHTGQRIEPNAFDLACALNPERVLADLKVLVKTSDHPRGPASAERTKRIDKLMAQLAQAEREEENLIVDFHQQGVNVHRRPDCNPAIVLEVSDGQ